MAFFAVTSFGGVSQYNYGLQLIKPLNDSAVNVAQNWIITTCAI